MYRLMKDAYPRDPTFPRGLKALGLFVNENDEIRQIEKPEEGFVYKVTKNPRLLEVRADALRSRTDRLSTHANSSVATLDIIASRLSDMRLNVVRLPLSAAPNDPHVPIRYLEPYGTPKRLLVLFGASTEDLGVLSYRLAGSHGHPIDKGAATGLLMRLMAYERGCGALLANPGQLYWRPKTSEAISWTAWQALPRKNASDPAWRLDERNLIPGNQSAAEHIRSVFEEFILGRVDKNVKLDIIGVADGCSQIISFLQDNWSIWKDRVAAIAFSAPHYAKSDLTNEEFKTFLKSFGRCYVSHAPTEAMPRGSLLPNTEFGCAVFSSGVEDSAAECILPHCYDLVLDFFHERATVPSFANPALEEVDAGDEEATGAEDVAGHSGWQIAEDEKASLQRGYW